jgi:hypothetical protein
MMKAKNAALAFLDSVDQDIRESPNLQNLNECSCAYRHGLGCRDMLRPDMP